MKLARDGSAYKDINFNINGIFIPAKEILSHSNGFLALNNKYDMPFDKTYIDIITNAELPESKDISEINKKILKIISKIINGEVVYENDNFYVIKNDGSKIDFSIEAEGIRKFALLWKLIRNGLIDNDTILFWDEPESNIKNAVNPNAFVDKIKKEPEKFYKNIAKKYYDSLMMFWAVGGNMMKYMRCLLK